MPRARAQSFPPRVLSVLRYARRRHEFSLYMQITSENRRPVTSGFASCVRSGTGHELTTQIHALFFAEIVDESRNVLAQTEQEPLK